MPKADSLILDAPGLTANWPPSSEVERLAALHRLRLLDTPPSESFDRITRLVSACLNVPVALVSLIDQSRQWFKSCVGIDLLETPREFAFCTHTIALDAMLVVPDTARDARFRSNPLVTGAPHVRAYVGIPLHTTDHQPVGTLCIVDVKVRHFDAKSLQMFREFAHVAEELIQRQEVDARTDLALTLAADRERLFRDTFEQAAVGITHTSLMGHLTRINPCGCQLFGYTPDEMHMVNFGELTHPDDLAESLQMFFAIQGGTLDRYHIEKRYKRKDGTYFWATAKAAISRVAPGSERCIITVIDDISVRKRAELELLVARDALQREVARQGVPPAEARAVSGAPVDHLAQAGRGARGLAQRLHVIANGIPAFIGYWNTELRCEFANEAYQRAFCPASDIIGMHMRDVLGETGYRVAGPHALRALEGHPQEFERVMASPSGQKRFFEMRFIPDGDADGELQGFFDFSERADGTRVGPGKGLAPENT